MKITINSTDLSRALATVSRCISSKCVCPVLEYFHIEALGEDLRITGSDGENWFSVTVRPTDITYLDEGFSRAFCIDSKRFLAIIRGLPSQPIGLELSSDHTSATLRWLNGKAQLPILTADEYPMPADKGSAVATPMSASALRNIIDTCSFAIGHDDLRPVMNGIYFDRTGDDALTCCATNGYQLARMTMNNLKTITCSFILPARAAGLLGTLIAEVERCTGKEEPSVDVSVNGNNVSFHTERAVLISRMIEGRYPNYNSVIPQGSPYEMIIPRTDLMASLRRTMVFANSTTQLVRLQPSAERLVLSADDTDLSISSEESVPCTFNGPDNFAIGFKGPLLLDILSHMDTTEVRVELTDQSRAGVFFPHGGGTEGQELLMLLMPMMLQS